MINMARAVSVIAEAGAPDARSFVAVRSRVNSVHARFRLWVKTGILPGALKDGRAVTMRPDDVLLAALLDRLADASVTATRLAEVAQAVTSDELWQPATDGAAGIAAIVILDREKTTAYLTDRETDRPRAANYMRIEISGLFEKVLCHLEQEVV